MSDRESLQLIRDAAGQEDVADMARQQLQQSCMAFGIETTRELEPDNGSMRKLRGPPPSGLRAETLLSSEDPFASQRSFELGAHNSKEQTIPSTPDSLMQIFPSSETLFLQHDNESSKGNLALCVATATDRGFGPRVQLFYLKMKDIKRRKFSFRRVSGEEVCVTSRMYRAKVRRRTRVRRSISSSMSSIQSISSSRRSSLSSQISAMGSSEPDTDSSSSRSSRHNTFQRKLSAPKHHQRERSSIICACCPEKPQKFDTLEDLR